MRIDPLKSTSIHGLIRAITVHSEPGSRAQFKLKGRIFEYMKCPRLLYMRHNASGARPGPCFQQPCLKW